MHPSERDLSRYCGNLQRLATGSHAHGAHWRWRSAYRRWSGQASATRPLTGAGEVLNAAAWTYIAAFTLTFAQLLRLLRWGRLVRPPF